MCSCVWSRVLLIDVDRCCKACVCRVLCAAAGVTPGVSRSGNPVAQPARDLGNCAIASSGMLVQLCTMGFALLLPTFASCACRCACRCHSCHCTHDMHCDFFHVGLYLMCCGTRRSGNTIFMLASSDVRIGCATISEQSRKGGTAHSSRRGHPLTQIVGAMILSRLPAMVCCLIVTTVAAP